MKKDTKASRLFESGDIDGAVKALKDVGYTPILSIAYLRDIHNFNVSEAKTIVYPSSCWEGQADSIEKFIDRVMDGDL